MGNHKLDALCLCHSADLDGMCSGAIFNKWAEQQGYKNALTYGINYGDPTPWDLIDGNDVCIIDFTPQPFEVLLEIQQRARGLGWIDHHKTAIEDWEKAGKPDIAGKREIGRAGCELAWDWFFPKETMPLAVYLLGRYDVWDHSDERTLPFQYGMRLDDWLPPDARWSVLLDYDSTPSTETLTQEIIEQGKTVLKYQESQYKKYINSRGFSAIVDFKGHKYEALACNAGLVNSQLFEGHRHAKDAELWVAFSMKKGKIWTVSLYSNEDHVDCSAIAKAYGGGGHKGAAGFQGSFEDVKKFLNLDNL